MKKFITFEEFKKLNDEKKKMYEVVFLDYETQCISCGYILKN